MMLPMAGFICWLIDSMVYRNSRCTWMEVNRCGVVFLAGAMHVGADPERVLQKMNRFPARSNPAFTSLRLDQDGSNILKVVPQQRHGGVSLAAPTGSVDKRKHAERPLPPEFNNVCAAGNRESRCF